MAANISSGNAGLHVSCNNGDGHAHNKLLAKELHQDPAVLSRGFGKLAEELASKPKLRGIVERLSMHGYLSEHHS
ncbi:MAG TPA: hypothetical protein VK573_11460, partial [Gemmatimonadales bacterium]|nr:hypothetical protein [Gemmatimonadales bacterium]